MCQYGRRVKLLDCAASQDRVLTVVVTMGRKFSFFVWVDIVITIEVRTWR